MFDNCPEWLTAACDGVARVLEFIAKNPGAATLYAVVMALLPLLVRYGIPAAVHLAIWGIKLYWEWRDERALTKSLTGIQEELYGYDDRMVDPQTDPRALDVVIARDLTAALKTGKTKPRRVVAALTGTLTGLVNRYIPAGGEPPCPDVVNRLCEVVANLASDPTTTQKRREKASRRKKSLPAKAFGTVSVPSSVLEILVGHLRGDLTGRQPSKKEAGQALRDSLLVRLDEFRPSDAPMDILGRFLDKALQAVKGLKDDHFGAVQAALGPTGTGKKLKAATAGAA